jgi:hypothetical protein
MNKSYFDPIFCIKYRKKLSNNTIEFVIMIKNGRYRVDEQVSFSKELVFKKSFFTLLLQLLSRATKLDVNVNACFETSQACHSKWSATIKHVYKWYNHAKGICQVKKANYVSSAFLDKNRNHEEYISKSWLLSEYY